MVTRSNSECSSRSDDEDTLSVATSASDKSQPDNRLALPGEGPSSFGSIAVTNSTDVHFGTKTYYQGPVTIKQFLYANQLAEKCAIEDNCIVLDSAAPDIAKHLACGDNPGFVPDVPLSAAAAKNATPQQQPPPKEGRQWFRNFPKQHLFLVFSLAAVLLVSLITLMTVLLTRHAPVIKPTTTPHFGGDSPEQDKGRSPLDYPIDPKVNVTLPAKLKIITRKEWLAQPPSQNIPLLPQPVPYVIISHTATEGCGDQAACTFHVRFLQTFHIESTNYWDIGFNFLIGGDGYAYEGRGWLREGAHTLAYNSKSVGIAFVGTFHKKLPPDRQIIAAKMLIRQGLEGGHIAPDFKLLGVCQLESTSSPGKALFDDLKSWPHWAEEP